MTRFGKVSFVAAFLVALLGCSGEISRPTDSLLGDRGIGGDGDLASDRPWAPGSPSAAGSGLGSGSGNGDGDGDGDGDDATDPTTPRSGGGGALDPGALDDCVDAELTVGPSFTVRLTEGDYNRTLGDLFAPYGRQPSTRELPEESLVHGFVQARAQDPSAAFIEQYELGAWEASDLSAEQLEALAPCPSGDVTACGQELIESFGKRAFRRPLSDEQRDRYLAFFEDSTASWDYDSAVAMTVSAMLQAPEFLYLIEHGEAAGASGLIALDDHSVASRLSYMLTGSMPDDRLMAAADAGELGTAEQVRSHAERLLQGERARDVVRRFHERWLDIDRIWDLQKSQEEFPSFSIETEAALRESAERFVEWAFWEDGSLDALLGSSTAFVDDRLAPLYGVEAPAGSGFELVDLGARRAGFFTQAGWLAKNANPTEDSPVHRGIFIRERVLCADTPAPPDTGIPPLPMKGPDMTTRENLEQRHQQGTCGGCHRLFDGIGFAFGHYDAIGAFRDLDNGKPVDATGDFVAIDGLEGVAFDGAPDMMDALSDTPVVARCLSTQWLRFGLRRDITPADACTIATLASGLQQGGEMRELLLSLATSQAFFHKALEEE